MPAVILDIGAAVAPVLMMCLVVVFGFQASREARDPKFRDIRRR
jgi:hypothetical protein